MVFYHAASLAAIRTSLTAISQVHGGYRAIGLLADALGDVETPEEFDAELQQLRSRQGPSYQGPEDADRELLKAAHTAAHEEPAKRDALTELMALVLMRLGTSQASRILSMLLMSAGMNPLLMQVVLQVCLLLAQSDAGRRILRGSQDRLREVLPAAMRESRWKQQAESLYQSLQQQGLATWSRVSDSARGAWDRASQIAQDWTTGDSGADDNSPHPS